MSSSTPSAACADEPGADLAVLQAIVSSFKSRPLPAKHVVFGEVGRAGEVRPVQRGQERLKEAAKLGLTHAIIPKANKPRQKIEGMEIIVVKRVEQAGATGILGAGTRFRDAAKKSGNYVSADAALTKLAAKIESAGTAKATKASKIKVPSRRTRGK